MRLISIILSISSIHTIFQFCTAIFSPVPSQEVHSDQDICIVECGFEQPPVWESGTNVELIQMIAARLSERRIFHARTVILSFVVTEAGNVEKAKVTRCDDPFLSERLIRIIAEMKFTPGSIRGKPVKCLMHLPFKC